VSRKAYGLPVAISSSVSVSVRIQFLNWQRAAAIRTGSVADAGRPNSTPLCHLPLHDSQLQDSKDPSMKKHMNKRYFTAVTRVAALGALVFLSVNVSPAFAATLSRSVDVNGTLSAVWAMIGPFCAIRDWLPPVGTCTENGAVPPQRTLVTKDGKATFVETQTARSDAEHSYSYTFKSSPLPVTNYTSTIKVLPKSEGVSTVIWSSTYVPDPGKEQAALEALTGIYEAGLATIKEKFAK
jgi:hypothetical protein